jgi:hypothetical protein
MHRLSTTAVAGMLALTIAGCSSGGEENSSASVQPTAATQTSDSSSEPSQAQSQPVIVAQKPANDQKADKTQDQKSSQNKPPIALAPSGLIQPTNPNQRTQQVQKGRPDPFAELYTPQPQVAAAPKPASVKLPTIPPPPVLKPTPLPPPMPPVAPPQPQPDLARGTTVLGVVEVGNQFQAIVQVPNEATSRYVSEGQRLADGQVTVKRIEMYPGSEPVVVLEQFGQEISRAVGQEPAQANTGTTPGAPGKTSSAISVPSIPPTSGSVPGVSEQNALPPSPPTIESSESAAPNQQPTENSPENSSSPEALKNKLKTSPPQDDSNSNAQSSSETQPAIQTRTFLPTVQPSTAFPEETQPNSVAQPSDGEASVPETTPEAPPANEPVPASESEDTSQQQSSRLPSAQQSKQRLVALLTRSPLANGTKTTVQSNSKARMYRQGLIDRLLKSK